MASIVAITVSTNYHDILPIVYHNNRDFFKHWVFITDKNDIETIRFLSDKPNVTVLYWDFKNERRLFDKGGAVRHAQYYVYEKFPEAWYLILDSDIIIPKDVQISLPKEIYQIENLTNFAKNSVFGLGHRLDFSSLSDLLSEKNYIVYDLEDSGVYGYFQLYKEKYFYSPSRNASFCDAEFTKFFFNRFLLQSRCFHLGKASVHWDGTRQCGSDFVIDVKTPLK